MIEQRLPIFARWSLFALGVVGGPRVLRPVDPVAAWLLRDNPGLVPSVPAPALLTAIRARTLVVDALLAEEVARAAAADRRFVLWTIGGGFDARWVRCHRFLRPQLAGYVEVEEGPALEHKARALTGSPFEGRWNRVLRRPGDADGWTVRAGKTEEPVVIIEGVASRFDQSTLRDLLLRIRQDAPNARLILDLTGIPTASRAAWSARGLEGIGWRPDVDLETAPRERRQTITGQEICPGMRGFRLVRCSPVEPRQT